MPDNTYILTAAFERVTLLERLYGDDFPWPAIDEGVVVAGERVHLANKARGIFKPRQMSRGLMSIKTTKPRVGRVNIYDDQETEEGFFRYSLQSGDTRAGGNRYLWQALEDQSPFLYFHAVAEARYKAIWPCYVTHINEVHKFAEVVVGTSLSLSSDASVSIVEYPMAQQAPERAYSVREARVRLHQATFRANVLSAYHGACALSGLPVRELLEAAHITPDTAQNSSTEVSNGIAMSRLHHRAYDSNLIGISPDLRIAVSHRLRDVDDGLILDALKQLDGSRLRVPKTRKWQPDRERLEQRFIEFQAT